MQVKLAALKRAKIPESERVPHYLYVDEFQNYVSASFESILSEARKYKVGLVVAHQYIEQLKQEVEDLKDKVSALKEVNAKLAANEKFVKDTLKDITRREAELEPQEKALGDAKAAFETEKAEVKALKIDHITLNVASSATCMRLWRPFSAG